MKSVKECLISSRMKCKALTNKDLTKLYELITEKETFYKGDDRIRISKENDFHIKSFREALTGLSQ